MREITGLGSTWVLAERVWGVRALQQTEAANRLLDAQGLRGALRVSKRSACPESWQLQGKGPCTKICL